MKNKFVIKIFQLSILFMFVLLWQLIVNNSSRLQFLFGSPKLVSSGIIESWTRYEIYIDIFYTFSEALLGFIVGNIFGIIIGLSLAYFPLLAKITKPYIIALGAIPIFSLAPMMIIWFGTGFISKVIMSIFSTVLITTLQAYTGAQSVDKKYEILFRSLNANKRDYFIHVQIPNSLIWVLASFRITVGFSLLGAFIGEFISSERGLGHLILKAGGLYNIPQVIVGLVHIIVIALVLNYFVVIIEKTVTNWKIE